MNRLHFLPLGFAVGCAALFAGSCTSPEGRKVCDTPDGLCGGPGDSGPQGVVHPVFGPTHQADVTPPPISGGTLLIAKEGVVVASDPDRDAVYVVDLASRGVTTIPMQPGDEPGRLVEDDSGHVHVALRSGGAIASIDLASKAVIGRRSVCVAPRGLGYDSADASLYVACASGELVQMPAAGGAATRTLMLDRDLRDVVVLPTSVVVTRFRSAESIDVSKQAWATIGNRVSPPPGPLAGFQDPSSQRTPAVAWRTLASPNGQQIFMLHQRGAPTNHPVATSEGGYASGGSSFSNQSNPKVCQRSIVEAALTVTSTNGVPVQTSLPLSGAVVPVDLAISPDSSRVAIAAAGNAFNPGAQSVLVYDTNAGLFSASPRSDGTTADCAFPNVTPPTPGQATAVAFTADSRLVVQIREPAALFLPDSGETIRLSNISRDDTGHDVFHANSGGNIACASCHPEGGDDGRVWSFDTEGPRRTPSLKGTVGGTAPYHWGGEMADFTQLSHDVFSKRMSGPTLASDQTAALNSWVTRIPAPVAPPAVDAASVARGQALFEGKAECSTCHSGSKLTDNESVDVGTGGKFQVPPLVGVAYRAPLQHDGCATTLKDRFTTKCDNGQHGKTAALSPAEITDLVAYLETL